MTNTVNVKLSDGQRVADNNGLAPSCTVVKLNADGSVYSYSTNQADGSILQLIFDPPTAQTRTTFGPNGEYVRGDLSTSSCYFTPPGSPAGTQGYLEQRAFKDGVMTSYRVDQVGSDFSFTAKANDDGTAEATLLTPLSPKPITASGLGTLNGLASISSRDIFQTKGGLLIGQDGGTLVAPTGAPIISRDSAGLIGQDGGTIISRDSAGLIGQDGGTIISRDGAGIISRDSAGLIGQDGGSFTARQFSAAATSDPNADVKAAAKFAVNLMSDLRGRGAYSANSFAPSEGGGGDDVIQGGEFADVLRGRLGADALDGDAGNDILHGADSDFIRNGSFETVHNPQFDANGYGYNGAIDGWTLVSGPNLELFKAGVAGTPAAGRYGVDLEGNQINTNAAISQVVQGLIDGQTYRLAFEARKVSAEALARLQVSFGGQTLTWSADGGAKAYIDPTTATLIYYIDLTGGTGTGADRNRLTFSEIGTGDTQGTLLDKVRMYRVEPNTPKSQDNDPYADGNDSFLPGIGSDIVYGHGGDDAVIFTDVGPGTDQFAGGAGTDLLVMDWSASTTAIRYLDLVNGGSPNIAPLIGQARSYERDGAVSGEGKQQLFFNEVERFVLSGGSAGDTLAGGELKDILIGNGGNDTLIGGGGPDELDGGEGFDTAIISLSGNGKNTIDLKKVQNGGTITLSDGTKLTSIEAIQLKAGGGDDFLDVRGTVANPSKLASDNGDYPTTGTRFEGFGGNDTLAIDLATSREAFFDGGTGTSDLLIMDWSEATRDVVRYNESYGGSYQSFWKTVAINGNATNLYFKVGFSGVERFDLTGGKGNDQLFGADGADRIKAIGGTDTATLGSGADTLVVDYSNTSDGGYGVGYFDDHRGISSGSLAEGYGGYFGRYGSNANVTFSGAEHFDLTLTNRSDRVITGDGDDIVKGLSGADTLRTGKGIDSVDGGDGVDSWTADKSAMTGGLSLDLNVIGLQATYSVTSEVTGRVGTATVRDIEQLGSGAADPFRSGSGNDVITTHRSAYNDQVATGAGTDTVRVYGGSDWVDLGANATGSVDTLVLDYSATTDGGYGVGYYDEHRGITSGSLAAGYGGYFGRYGSNANVTFSGVERFDLTLTGRGDRVITGDGDDTLKGRGGDDVLSTGKGFDIVDGGAEADRWVADKSAMTTAQAMALDLTKTGLQGTYNVRSEVTGANGTGVVRDIDMLTLTTGAGNDVIVTQAASYDDQVTTGAGSDRVKVAGGTDTATLGAGVDTLVVDYSATADGGYGVGYFDEHRGITSGKLADGYGGYFARYGTNANVTFSGAEHFDLTLTGRDDRVITGDGDDIVKGLSGADTLRTGKGVDNVDGGDGVDSWTADKSAMTGGLSLDLNVIGLQATYSVKSEVTGLIGTATVRDIEQLGSGAADPFRSGSGNDVITTHRSAFNDQVATGAGTDTVRVYGGSDWVDLGANATGTVDTLVLDYSATADGGYGVGYYDEHRGVTSGSLAGGYGGYFGRYGSNANVTFSGVERFDLTLTSRDDRVITGDGDDTIDGRGGNDTMSGKGGNDTYIVDSAGDLVFENAKSGYDTVRASVSYVLDISQEVELLTTTNDAGKDAINLTGSLWANSLRGNAGDNILDGGLGADTMTGLAGNDTYLVNDANDLVYDAFKGGTDTVKVAAGAGRYVLLGAQEIETLTAADVAATGALNLTGNEFAQTLVGNAGANVLRGGGGADILNGLRGVDTADYGDKTTAVVVALNGGSLVTVTVGGVAEDRIVNIENLIGGSAADRLTGDAGANVLDGGLGADTLTGLLGNDTYLVDNVGDQVIEATGGGVDTVRTSASYTLAAGQEIEALTTTNAAATVAINLTGNAFVQAIVGNAGSNTLDGGLGADTMTGLSGNDTYFVDNLGDRVIEAKGGGSDAVRASVGYILAAGQEIETLTTTNAAATVAINLTGNEFGQSINGNDGANVLRGNGGADILNGLGGLDTADYGDKAVAVEVALNGAKVVAVTVGGVIEDRIVNIENLIGGAVADRLTGDGLGNVLDGGKGADTLTGLTGNDTYLVDNAGDRVIEAKGGGSDTVRASVSYTLAAGQEIETLTTTNAAGTSAINLTGNEFGQVITGNAGANILTGGAGVDRLTGGLGRDTFDFNARTDSGTTAATRDVILDFKQGEDRIDLSTIDANGSLAGDAFEFLAKAGSAFTGKAGQLVYSTVDATGTDNDRTVLQADMNGDKIADFQIELKGLHTLTTADFVL